MITSCTRLVVVALLVSLTLSLNTFSQTSHKILLHFATDGYQLSTQQQQYLDSVFLTLRNIPDAFSFNVTGHTDNVGTSEYNNTLSSKRASSVVNYLKSKGFKRQQINWHGKGFNEPIATNDNDANKEMNRRVEIVFQLSLPELKTIAGLTNAVEKIPVVSNGGTITTTTGTKITIPADAFVDAYGKPVTGKIDIDYKEYRDPVDFLMSDIPMHFNTPDGLVPFNSAGMFTITASKDNAPVFLKDGKQLDVGFNYNTSIPDLNFYRFDSVKRTWQELQPIPKNTRTVQSNWGECMTSFPTPSLCTRAVDFKTVYLVYTGIHYADEKDSSLYKFVQKRKLIAMQEDAKTMSNRYIMKSQRMLRRFVVDIERRGLLGKDRFKIYRVRGQNDVSSRMLEEVYFTGNDKRTIDSIPQRSFDDIEIERSSSMAYTITFISKTTKKQVDNIAIHSEQKDAAFNTDSWINAFKVQCAAYKDLAVLYKDTAAIFAKEGMKWKARIDDLYFDTWLLSEDSLKCFQQMHQPWMSEQEKKLSFDEWLVYYASHKPAMLKIYNSERAKPGFAETLTQVKQKMKNIYYYRYGDLYGLDYATTEVVMTNFSVPSLGTYNCDQLQRLQDPVNLYVQYKNATGEAIKPVIAYLIDSRINGLLRFDGSFGLSPYRITYSPTSSSRMVLVDAAGETYVVKPDAFASVDPKQLKSMYTFVAEPVSNVKNKQELKAVLRL
jgi:hypothetical protein